MAHADPDLLALHRAEPTSDTDPDRGSSSHYELPMPATSPEGIPVVFGGQVLAQMIIAASAEQPGKYVKSLSTTFSRAGSYDAPVDLEAETFHAGRNWASQLLTARQDGRLLTRGLALLTADEPDLIAHAIAPPATRGGPEDSAPVAGVVYPGGEARAAQLVSDETDGVPAMAFWTRMPEPISDLARSQAILAWATNGWLIELNLRPHPEIADPANLHVILSTGVIGHTISFHREFDAGEWLLLSHEASFAGKGRVHGRGAVFTQAGRLVATFAQDSMVRRGGRGPGAPL